MTTITITGKQPGKTDVTISSTVNPAVKTVVPVTVKSRNLLSYGPAEGNGLTATVNSDGSLHITGTASKQWAGVAWVFPCPVQGNVTLRTPTSITGLSVNVKFLDARGGVPMFLSTPWGVDVSGFRLAVVGALRPAGGVRRPFPCGPVQATRAGSW